MHVSPSTLEELEAVVADLASEALDLLVIDGGDGTVRDVLSAASRHFGDSLPPIVVIPAGKTNALAMDLGVRRNWSLEDALGTTVWHARRRYPLELRYENEACPRLRGFLLGTGSYVYAVELAQTVHRAGIFGSIAVAMSILRLVGVLTLGRDRTLLSNDETMKIALTPHRQMTPWRSFLMLATTLELLPLGMKPFGKNRAGLKALMVDAAPKRLIAAIAALTSGIEWPWLARNGYVRVDPRCMRLRLKSEFVLDGERFAGGDIAIREGRGLTFLVPEIPNRSVSHDGRSQSVSG